MFLYLKVISAWENIFDKDGEKVTSKEHFARVLSKLQHFEEFLVDECRKI